MIYQAFEAQSMLFAPVRDMARWAIAAYGPMLDGIDQRLGREFLASWELIVRAGFTHHRPPFGIDSVSVGNREVPVTEVAVHSTAFGTLLHFKKDTTVTQPRVLVVAPLSGHFATLLRNTVRTLLADHDVYITDWHNARDVPWTAGDFGFDDYVGHLIQFLQVLGPGAHVVAVCQPCVQALAAAAVMAEAGDPAQPRSMTLMAGPVDVRINPTKVNELAFQHSYEWFESNLISTVPLPNAGAGRRVYPGFLQLIAFMTMNQQRHVKAHLDLHGHIAAGETDKAEAIRTFYDEYFAVLDLTAEFYLETIDRVFQRALLAKGELTYRGRKVNPGAITKTALLTVEGERDDICALGQTVAAHDLCTGLKPFRKRHHMQAGVGHYGVFSGRKWDGQVYPIVRNMVLASE
ncbi:polyhydroxyalkanoate depolymerase [Phreatobacter stygius]|uniref:Polyhydroxyalkanoate depolymerase n=1 Tax=Phreatobacter stygius TaxID=1940610 RepID=A0A4D7B3U4_9HYPH|nr:polyhydroxyalkanoate depolymerase [Phreatobacter stygius]QCI65925.1 polyhydroxyalkanoate depolymerase [Phreatobacter stygius]